MIEVPELAGITVNEYPLRVATKNVLRRAGYQSVSQVRLASDKALLAHRQLGVSTLREIRAVLGDAPADHVRQAVADLEASR